MSFLVGEAVECTVCHMTKAPRGRSVPLAMGNSRCNHECPGYREDPQPGDLWPGETREEFGYPDNWREIAQFHKDAALGAFVRENNDMYFSGTADQFLELVRRFIAEQEKQG